jgi:hypothetical protein
MPKVSTATSASGAARPAWKYAGRYRQYVRQWHVDRIRPSSVPLSAAPIQGLLALLDDDDAVEESPLIWTLDPQSQRVPFSAKNAEAWQRALHIEARAPIVSFQGFLVAHKAVETPEPPDSSGYRVLGPYWEPESVEKIEPGPPIRNEFGSVIGHHPAMVKRRPRLALDGEHGFLRNGSLAWSEDRLTQEYNMHPDTKRVERVVLRVDATGRKHTVLNEDGNFLTEWVDEEDEGAVLHEYRMRCGHGGYPPREAWFRRVPPAPELHRFAPQPERISGLEWHTRKKNQHAKLLRRRDEITTLLRQLGEEHDTAAVEAQLAAGPIGSVMSSLLARWYERRRQIASQDPHEYLGRMHEIA